MIKYLRIEAISESKDAKKCIRNKTHYSRKVADSSCVPGTEATCR